MRQTHQQFGSGRIGISGGDSSLEDFERITGGGINQGLKALSGVFEPVVLLSRDQTPPELGEILPSAILQVLLRP